MAADCANILTPEETLREWERSQEEPRGEEGQRASDSAGEQ